MPDPIEPTETPEAPKPPEPVEEDIEDQHVPVNSVQQALDGFNSRAKKIEDDFAEFTAWRNSLVAEREQEKEERRQALEEKEKHGEDQSKTKTEGHASRRIKIFRRNRAG